MIALRDTGFPQSGHGWRFGPRGCCTLLLLSCVWYVYAAWEQYCTAGAYNIRIDLLVLPYFMLLMIVVAFVATLVPRRRDPPR